MTTQPSSSSFTSTRGFTLVEIMVGMVIAMLGIIIMMQMFGIFESQKRTTTGGDDAQNAGAIALYTIQLNVQQAGYCFSAASSVQLAAVGTLNPVMIDPAPLAVSSVRDTNTNALMVAFGNDSCPPESASGPANAATMNIIAYAVKNGRLMQCDYMASNCALSASWFQIAPDVVSLVATCEAGRGIRIALVTRNPQLEQSAVTAASPSWSNGAIDVSAAATDATATDLANRDGNASWEYYRYKTFETSAPIRNSLWTGAPGC